MYYLMKDNEIVIEIDTLKILNEILLPNKQWITMKNENKNIGSEFMELTYNPLKESVYEFIEKQYKLVKNEESVKNYVHTIFPWETLDILAETEVKNTKNNYWFQCASDIANPIQNPKKCKSNT